MLSKLRRSRGCSYRGNAVALPTDYVKKISENFRDESMAITAWIIGLLVLVALLWLTTEHSLRQEERRVRSHTIHQAIALSNSYATQLSLLAEQMNQILLRTAVRWSETPASLDLQRDQQLGLFPDRGRFFIGILDQEGMPIRASSTSNNQD